ncbi:MAG: serine/threonine-protein kinase [Myxococcota bacterium]
MACPDPEALCAFSQGRLDPEQRAEVEAQLDGCESCCQVVSDLVRIYASQSHLSSSSRGSDDPAEHEQDYTIADQEDSAPPPRPRLAPGTRLDRYHVLEPIGSGGMGVVYAAYDADLDRKVALKVLHEYGRQDGRAQRRLLREAQAMARLSHPNVITVHEVRMVEGRVFISMEFVERGTLTQWLKREQPDQARVLAMFRDIGRGLAAAHAVGLVHRDIKPDNVLIGADERPRVTDFGLARVADDELSASHEGADRSRRTTAATIPGSGPGSSPGSRSGSRSDSSPGSRSDSSPGSSSGSGPGSSPAPGPGPESKPGSQPGTNHALRPSPHATLTRTGALVGTPAYMAPEQFRRKTVTAASDQFSFCVALYEALYGQRPFRGRSLPELAACVLSQAIVEPTRDRDVPRWLHRVVLRGLSVRPEDRWPSMDVLVEHLEPAPRRRWRRLVVGGVALALVGAGSAASLGLSTPGDPCAQGQRSMDELWADHGREQLRQALSEGASPYAEQTATISVRRVDDYVQQWITSHRDACEGYQRGEQSSEALDLRGACLDRRRGELSALLSVLIETGPAAAEHAVKAIDELPPIEPCADIKALRARVPPPTETLLLRRVRAIERDLARARALLHAGQYEDGQEVASEAARMARDAGYAPLRARALKVESQLMRRLGQDEPAARGLREAWQQALGAGDDLLAAECVVALVDVLGYSLQRFDDARVRIDDARAMIERVRHFDPTSAEQLEEQLLLARGQLAYREHRIDDAIDLFRSALKRTQARAGANGLATADALKKLAGAVLAQQGWDEALRLYQHSHTIIAERLGPTHPITGNSLNSLGLTLKNMGRYEEAIEHYERARLILLDALDPEHPAIPMVEINLAEAHFSSQRFAQAVALYDRHAEKFEAEQITYPHILRRAAHYARSLAKSGRYAEARARMAVVMERAEPLGDPVTGRAMEIDLAAIDLAEGHPRRALKRLDTLQMPPTDPGLGAEIALTRALALLARDEPGDFERARALRAQIEASRDERGVPEPQRVQRLVKRLAAREASRRAAPP